MIPIRHIERLAQDAEASSAPAVRLSAQVVTDWLDAVRNDPANVLEAVMSAIGRLPSCPKEFLGSELHARVQAALGQEEQEEIEENG